MNMRDEASSERPIPQTTFRRGTLRDAEYAVPNHVLFLVDEVGCPVEYAVAIADLFSSRDDYFEVLHAARAAIQSGEQIFDIEDATHPHYRAAEMMRRIVEVSQLVDIL